VKSKLPKIQLTIILVAIAYFSTLGAGFSAAYGGVISLMNTGLVNRHTNKQREDLTISAQAGVGMMAISVIMRMAMVVGLTLAGHFLLKLSADALIVSLVLGLIGFLMDKVLQK
jgi:ATP synthase protein I